ncbi:unnamed protein product [Paramecium pentaurelia]|uniref:Uncharacterized protein n=1 Tax=Paramecium pentaurelia TaxID=43138 RepID=A0A8S1TGL9_9CILI|nr:unnamed protein product [Paramecium pentaurelia]
MKINTQKKSSHNKTDNSNNCKTFYNAQNLNQTLNSFQFKYPQIKEINENLVFSNSNLVFGNYTQQIMRKGLLNIQNSKEQKHQQTQKEYIRRRVNTSYIVYPIENNRNLTSQNMKENYKQSRLLYRVQIPDTMKIPFLNKKNRLIKDQLKQFQNRQQIQQDDIRIASRISFHTKTKSNIIKKQNPNVNEQLQIIVDEHQSSDLSFINGWE